jgi:hypothetical protein
MIAATMSLGLAFATLAGCATSPEPGVTAQFNKLETEIEAQPEAVAQAASEVLQDMELYVISSEATRMNGRVIARSSQDRKVSVDLANVGDATRVTLRGAGGWWQDKGLGLTILERIRRQAQQQQPGQGQPQDQQQFDPEQELQQGQQPGQMQQEQGQQPTEQQGQPEQEQQEFDQQEDEVQPSQSKPERAPAA